MQLASPSTSHETCANTTQQLQPWHISFPKFPNPLPQRLSVKIAAQLQAVDYVHINSDRISSSVRRVLRYPADNLRVGLQRSVEQLGFKREETRKICSESEVARKYFGNLVDESAKIRNTVENVDLDGPAPGVAASFD